jgi:hypothetical protein
MDSILRFQNLSDLRWIPDICRSYVRNCIEIIYQGLAKLVQWLSKMWYKLKTAVGMYRDTYRKVGISRCRKKIIIGSPRKQDAEKNIMTKTLVSSPRVQQKKILLINGNTYSRTGWSFWLFCVKIIEDFKEWIALKLKTLIMQLKLKLESYQKKLKNCTQPYNFKDANWY